MRFFSYLIFLLISINASSQILGCTDPLSRNYNPNATINDGSCSYKNQKIKPIFSKVLADTIQETSGIIYWDNKFWTINDDTDTAIHGLDTLSGEILQSYNLKNTVNRDWEEISQDENYIYVGDIGNNVNANSKDLHILRVEKKSLHLNSPAIDTIYFSYEDQTDFSEMKSNKTNFDGEAFLVSKDSIFIFTKQWKAKKTSLYGFSKLPGKYTAKLKTTFDINGLVTGATYLEDKKIVVLCGYSKLQMPFIYLLYDFKNTDFFSGNKRKIKLKLPFRQVEGIAYKANLDFYLTNEKFAQWPILKHRPKLHKIDLSSFLGDYLKRISGLTNK